MSPQFFKPELARCTPGTVRQDSYAAAIRQVRIQSLFGCLNPVEETLPGDSTGQGCRQGQTAELVSNLKVLFVS